MDAIFDACVVLLYWLGGKFNMTYKEINVWIFVIIWPILTIALLMTVVRQRLHMRQMRLTRGMAGRKSGDMGGIA